MGLLLRKAIALHPAFLLVSLASLVSSEAFADDPIKRADQLFREAKALTDAGHYPPACPKLEESERLDPALGTEFNLADCYEHTERPAEAFKLFLAVAEAAHVAGKDARERSARARAETLEPQIGTAHIKFVTGAPPARARVVLDGKELREVGGPQFLAPGRHVLEVSGVDVTPWKTDLVIAPQETVDVAVPDLSAPRSAVTPTIGPKTPPPRTEAATRTSNARIVAYALAGGAIVGLGVGAGAGAISISDHDNAHLVCPVPSPCGDAHAASTWTGATTAGNVSTVAFIAGGALGVAALVVWIVMPGTTNARVSSACNVQGCSLGVRF